MNSVNVIGNIVSEEYRINEYTDKSNKKQYVINGTIAVNEPQGNNYDDVVTFINFTAFRGLAKVLKDLTVKGSQVALSGKWRKDVYEKNGKKYYNDYLLIENVKLLDTKEQTEEKRQKLKATDNTATNNVPNYNIYDDDDIPY